MSAMTSTPVIRLLHEEVEPIAKIKARHGGLSNGKVVRALVRGWQLLTDEQRFLALSSDPIKPARKHKSPSADGPPA